MKLGCADLSFFSARDNAQTPKMTDATDDELAVKRQDDVKTVERGIERIEIAKVEKPEKPPRTEKSEHKTRSISRSRQPGTHTRPSSNKRRYNYNNNDNNNSYNKNNNNRGRSRGPKTKSDVNGNVATPLNSSGRSILVRTRDRPFHF